MRSSHTSRLPATWLACLCREVTLALGAPGRGSKARDEATPRVEVEALASS
jgi:hypothetical protein